jgi:hypothetical protein
MEGVASASIHIHKIQAGGRQAPSTAAAAGGRPSVLPLPVEPPRKLPAPPKHRPALSIIKFSLSAAVMANSASGEENSRAIEILQDALQTLQNDANAGRQNGVDRKQSLRSELRSLDFWRAIIAECIGSFFYVFVVCGAIGHHSNSLLLSTISVALATGCGAAALIFCFGAVSGL